MTIVTSNETEENTDVNEDYTEEDQDLGDPEADLNLSEEERLARQRSSHIARMKKKNKARAKGLVILNTGNGKGKTTAAFGIVMRAWGQGLRVCMLQFIKAKTSNYGEEKAARKIGLEMLPLGDGFTWLSDNIEKDKNLALEGWELCKQKISSGDYDMVVVDEITYILKYGWLPWEEVKNTLDNRPEGVHVVLTGRYAPQELLDYADLVTEMNEIKHPFHSNIKAQKGVEF